MKGFVITCEVLYTATFRKPSSTSLILTYPLPPFTTVRGMLANALGLAQHDHSLQDRIKIGIRIIKQGYKNVEMAKILKLKENNEKAIRDYPSSPMFREFMVQPIYQFFITTSDDFAFQLHRALHFTKRPLYLGQSDDLVDITVSDLKNIETKIAKNFHSVVEGIHEDCIVEKLPYAFHQTKGRYSLEMKLVSIPKPGKTIAKEGTAFIFDGLNIELF